MEPNTNKLYWPEVLYERMKNVGLPTGKAWVLREERKGRLVVRQTANKRRLYTQQDIDGIIAAYSPGGAGKWNFKNG